METLKSWAKEKPVIAIAVVLIVVTLVYSLFFGSADVPV
jgi:preprotein translocase subunit SecE